MLVAKIFKCDARSVNSRYYSTNVLKKAVLKFGDTTLGHFAGIENYPPASTSGAQLADVAANVKLFIEDGFVKAEINLLDTNCGKMVKSMLTVDPKSVRLMPISSGTVNDIGAVGELCILRLVFPSNFVNTGGTDLRIMQEWVGQDHSMFEVYDDK